MSEGGGMGTALLGTLVAILVVVAVAILRGRAPKPPAEAPRRRGPLDRMQRNAAREDGDADLDGDDAALPDRAARREAAKRRRRLEKRGLQHQGQDDDEGQEEDGDEPTLTYADKIALREEERLARESDEREAQEEKELREAKEFQEWKTMFVVETEGEDNTKQKPADSIEDFVSYVKLRKMVHLEDLAAEFGLKTSAAIDRLKACEGLGRLSGIFDDRGKYLYITEEEMDEAAQWLKQKGRISRQELLATCNRIIRLNPTEEAKAKLQAAAMAVISVEDEPK